MIVKIINIHTAPKYISAGTEYYTDMLLVMFSFFALIIIGSFCHCTNAKAVEGGWSSSEPLHYEQQDARIATLSASEKLSELVFRLDIVECPVAELSQK